MPLDPAQHRRTYRAIRIDIRNVDTWNSQYTLSLGGNSALRMQRSAEKRAVLWHDHRHKGSETVSLRPRQTLSEGSIRNVFERLLNKAVLIDRIRTAV